MAAIRGLGIAGFSHAAEHTFCLRSQFFSERHAKMSSRDRRDWDRYELNEAKGALICDQVSIPCRFLEISMGGCSLRAEQSLMCEVSTAVEVTLAASGMALRIGGVVQRIGKENMVGIRFDRVSPQMKNELAALLTCLIDEGATSTVVEAVATAEDCGELEALSVRFCDKQEEEREVTAGTGTDNG